MNGLKNPVARIDGRRLTLPGEPPTNRVKVSAIPDSFYARWRVECGVVTVLREDRDSPPERLLQAIWLHQRLLREQLKTLDGQVVRVLHPGFHNLEGGPDFRQALIQFDDAPASQGDIEVDLRPGGWRAHGHDRNPAFRNVVLHVVWERERPLAGAPPLLCLREVLDAPLGELSLWLGGESAEAFPEELRGQCCAPLSSLAPKQLIDLLHQAAYVRLRSKAALFQARARQAGWEQSLWEGLFRALGYKNNVWAMQRLGELRPRWLAGCTRPQPLQARLLGLSGLLPGELTGTKPGTDRYLRSVWDQWWRERDEFSDIVLPQGMWRLHGLRPANHPQRRLALAAGWSGGGSLTARLEEWCANELTGHQMCHSLLEAFQVEPDDFWSWHWTLRSARLKRQQPLLGATRVVDFAMNVVIPWLWIRAVEGKNQEVQNRLEQRYFNWPAAEDNSVLRLARERLLGGKDRRTLPGAAAQQGLIQMVRDFCDHSNSVCHQCKLPDLARAAAAAAAAPRIPAPQTATAPVLNK
jgi:hypothetical protein